MDIPHFFLPFVRGITIDLFAIKLYLLILIMNCAMFVLLCCVYWNVYLCSDAYVLIVADYQRKQNFVIEKHTTGILWPAWCENMARIMKYNLWLLFCLVCVGRLKSSQPKIFLVNLGLNFPSYLMLNIIIISIHSLAFRETFTISGKRFPLCSTSKTREVTCF